MARKAGIPDDTWQSQSKGQVTTRNADYPRDKGGPGNGGASTSMSEKGPAGIAGSTKGAKMGKGSFPIESGDRGMRAILSNKPMYHEKY